MIEKRKTMSDIAAKQWVENWNRVGTILEQIGAEELRSPEYESGLDNFAPLLDWCCKNSEPKKESGLIEQQRYFMKARQAHEQQ